MMTDDELAQIAARVNAFQRSHDEAHFLLKMDARTLLREIERLRAREAALVAVVRVVAEADNSDNSMCYQLCDYAMHGNWMIEHEAPCVVKQARALLAATKPTDATTAE